MSEFFFSGSHEAKVDGKNRFVLPQSFRYGLVEEGKLEFTMGLGAGGCLAIYRRSDIQKIVSRFKENIHVPKFQKFFTLFFSTLHQTTCDKLGRVIIPKMLKNAVKFKSEIVLAGVLNKIEIWPKDHYQDLLQKMITGEDGELASLTEDAFSLLQEQKNPDIEL